MKRTIWISIFLLLLLGHLLTIYLDLENLRLVTKCLLMPVLAIYFFARTGPSHSPLRLWIPLALFFSWMGDILLMFESHHPSYFLWGLTAFLLAQVSYIIFFHGIRMRENIRGNALLLLLVVVYYAVLISVLSPVLGDMKLPVRIYGVVLSFMMMLAMHTVLGRNKTAAAWMMTGAILFVLSDSLLAFDKFYSAVPGAAYMIMLSYGLAQLFITYGATKYIISERDVSGR